MPQPHPRARRLCCRRPPILHPTPPHLFRTRFSGPLTRSRCISTVLFVMSSLDDLPGPSASSTSSFIQHRDQPLDHSNDSDNGSDNDASDTESESSSRSVSPEPKRPRQAKNKRPPFPFEYGVRTLYRSNSRPSSISHIRNTAFEICFLVSFSPAA